MAGNTFGVKADLWMPLDIGGWRRETAHLNPTEKAAYLALRMYYWEHGQLPKDPARLANIAQMSLDTWSITQEALSIAFFEDDSGVLHLGSEREKRANFALKRQKAREKAVKAINARWSKHRAKLRSQSSTSSDTPSIQEEIPENNLERLSVVHKSKDKDLPTPTPPAAQEGIKREVADTPSTPSRPTHGKGNEGKAKPRKPPARAAANSTNGTQPHPSANDRRAPTQRLSAGHSGNAGNPANGDFRARGFEDEVLRFWRGQNPEHPEYVFSGPDRRALRELLEHHQGLTLEEFRRLLANRAASSINPSAAPHKWLRSILDFSAGPLGKFGKPAAVARAL